MTLLNLKKIKQLILLQLIFVFAPVNAAIIFSDVYIFGDSLSDTGNTRATVPLGTFGPVAALAGYGPNGRFSNGILWHEYLSTDLGLPTSRSTAGGNNFAYGGAQINNDTGVSTGVLNQYQQYLNRLGSSPFDADALYIAWAGGNDMRALVGSANPFMAVTSAVNRFKDMLSGMLVNGAMTLLVPNLPNLGLIPEFAKTSNSSSGTEVSVLWNTLLNDMLIDLAKSSTADIYMLDVYSIFSNLLNDPASEGFTNTSDECRSVTGSFFPSERSCSNANQYLFWDEIHPTTAAHRVLGRETLALLNSGQTVYQQVPEPTMFYIFAGFVLLLIRKNQLKLKNIHQ
ncbi:MAG: SGNH/GDSL hydrolase family protein [Alishewanella sp.]|nr:SGNH/GDSL hydrolase family protein [Alishewanella sp.]